MSINVPVNVVPKGIEETKKGLNEIEKAGNKATKSTETLSKSMADFDGKTGPIDDISKSIKNVGKTSGDSKNQTNTLKSAISSFSGVGGPFGDLANKLKSVGASAESGAGGVKTLSSALSALSPGKLALIAGGFILLGTAMVALKLASASIEYANQIGDLQDMAEWYGLTATQISVMTAAAKESGTSLETVFSAMEKAGSAAYKGGEDFAGAAKGYKALGIEILDANGNLKSSFELASSVVTRYEEMGKTTEALAASQQVLGTEFLRVAPGIKAVSEAQQTAMDLTTRGVGISLDAIEAEEKYSKAIAETTTTFTNLKSELVAAVLPALTTLVQWFNDSAKSGGLVKTALDALTVGFNLIMGPIKIFLMGIQTISFGLDNMAEGVKASFMGVFTVISRLAEAGDMLFKGNIKGAKDFLGSQSVMDSFMGPLNDAKDSMEARRLAYVKRMEDLKQGLWGGGPIQEDKPGILGTGGGKPLPDEAAIKAAAAEAERKRKEAEAERKRQLDANNKSLERANDLVDVQRLYLLDMAGFDVDRFKIAQQMEKILKENTSLTQDQKNHLVDQALAYYDQGRQLKTNIDQQKEINDLLKSRRSLLDDINQRSGEEIGKARSKYDNRFKPKREREADEIRGAIVGPYDAAMTTTRRELTDAKPGSAQEGSLRQQLADLEAARNGAKNAADGIIQSSLDVEASVSEGLMRGVTAVLDTIPTTAEAVSTVVQSVSTELADGLFDLFTTGEMDVKAFFSTLLKELLRLQIQLQIIGPLVKGLGGIFGGGGFGTGATYGNQDYGSYLAKGGVVDNGSITKFATGGVVDRPTMFPLKGGKSGVMGEAGPEAIIPLKRGKDGNLGIAGGGGSSVQIINNVTVNGSDQQENGSLASAEILRAMKGIARQEVMEAKRVGGILNPV